MELINKKYPIYFEYDNNFSENIYKLVFCFNKLNYKERQTLYMLVDYMTMTTKKYNKVSTFLKRIEELPELRSNNNFKVCENTLFLNVNFYIVKPSKSSYSNIEDAYSFISEVLFNINVVNDRLDNELLNMVKQDYINQFKKECASNYYKSDKEYYLNVYKESFIKEKYTYSIDDYTTLINDIKDRDLLNMYNKLLNSLTALYVVGDLTNKDVNNLYNVFKFNSYIKGIKADNYINLTPCNTIYTDNNKLGESNIIYIYQNDKIGSDKVYKYLAINRLLTVNNVMHKIFRISNDIAYTSNSFLSYCEGIGLNVTTSIEKIDNAVLLFDEVINDLKLNIDEYIKMVKLSIDNDKLFFKEKPYHKINVLYNYNNNLELNYYIDLDNIYNMTKKEYLDFIDNLVLKRSFIVRGTSNE